MSVVIEWVALQKASNWLDLPGLHCIYPMTGGDILAKSEHDTATHNGARWSGLALTPGSHLGPFNDLQIYHPSLGELASLSWGRCLVLMLAFH